MSEPINSPLDSDDPTAEAAALSVAIGEARLDPRAVPHAEMRDWLLKIAAGDFNARAPEPRLL
jgi:hypothetical protein